MVILCIAVGRFLPMARFENEAIESQVNNAGNLVDAFNVVQDFKRLQRILG